MCKILLICILGIPNGIHLQEMDSFARNGCILSHNTLQSVYCNILFYMTHNLLNIFEEIFAHSRYMSPRP